MDRRTVIVEDDIATLEALAAAVDASPGYRAVAAVTSVGEGMSALARPYDLLLVDLNLGEQSGLHLIRASIRNNPAAPVLVISALGDERSVIAAIEAGASGYLLKDMPPTALVTSLDEVMEGNSPMSPSIARHLLRQLRPVPFHTAKPAEAQAFGLSPREAEVLEALAQGLSYKDVARRLEISVHTVGDYVKALYRKLHVSSRAQAVSVALERDLVRLNSRAQDE
jgi:DNA-binding NarL/FixJ family response regulator